MARHDLYKHERKIVCRTVELTFPLALHILWQTNMPSAIEWKSWTAVKRSMIEVTGEVGTIDNYGRGSKRYDVTGGFCVYAIGLGLPGEALVYIPTRAEVDLTCF